MMKVRKKLFTLSGLFMVLAQVFVAAFCGITAIAITKDETTKNLFDVNGSSATMAYELVDNDTIKWTVSLKKGAYDSPTRFMVDLVAGESSVVPEQIQSTNQEMVFESNYGDEYIQGGFSEQVTGSMSGETTISFVTTRQISNLVVTPKLVTVPAINEAMTMAATVTTDSTTEAEAEVQPTVASEPVNLLKNVPNVTFNIPAVEEEEENNTVVPETPVVEGETEAGTEEAPVDTTGNEEMGNPEVVAEEPEQEVEGTDSGSAASTLFQGFSTFAGIQATAEVKDPFKYYGSTNSDGIYPKHETNEFSQSGEDIDDTTDNIRNYNYGSDKKDIDDGVPLFDISGGGLDFRNGYHEYGNSTTGQINTKKTVMPTSDKNIFQIQLDTIGDAIRPFEDIDIVLVLDKSGSMRNESPTRWKQLQDAVKIFCEDILEENQFTNEEGLEPRIQIGMVGFHSDTYKRDGNWRTRSVRADVASFSNIGSDKRVDGFTSTLSDITSHPIYEQDAIENSGTPTFIGIDAGLNLLHDKDSGARKDAKKVMITVTDGVPTYYRNNYKPIDDDTNTTTTTIENDSKTMRYSSTAFGGNGNQGDAPASKTDILSFASERYAAYPNSYFYSIGFNMTDKDDTEEVIASAKEVLTALGPKGYYMADDVDKLVAALKSSVVEWVYTIANGTITDPMSQYVELVPNSIEEEGLYLADNRVLSTIDATTGFAKGISVKQENNQIVASNVTLGYDTSGRQGYRITYKVKLKDEFHTGKFYPTNGTTYLANGEKNQYYAVPSVRTSPTPVDVSFKKINTDNKFLAGAKFTLSNSSKTYISNGDELTGEDGVVTFTNVIPGNYVLKEIETPNGHTTMDDMEVTVTREGTITIRGDTKELETVENIRKPINISLTKIGEANESLAGARFVLRKLGASDFKFNEVATGLHKLENVAPGTYDLVETHAPAGYEILGKIGTLDISKYGTATFVNAEGFTQEITIKPDEQDDGIQLNLLSIKNNLKPIDINLNKIGPEGKALAGASFALQQGSTTNLKFTESKTTGLHEIKDVAPGIYDLVETGAPKGYKVLGKIGELEITKQGAVTLKNVGTDQDIVQTRNEGDRVLITFSSIKNSLKPFELEVKKRNADNHNQFLQGAVFTLYDKTPTDDTATELAKVTTDSNGKGTFKKTDGSIYQLEAGQEYFFKETTAPDGYVLSTSIYKVVVAIDGSVAITKDGNTVTEVTADLIPDNGNNQIGLTIDNKPKTPLPSTGGAGTMFFVTIGVLGLLSTGLYFLQRKDQEVA